MMIFTNEQFDTALSNTPKEVSELLARVPYFQFVENFVSKYGVQYDELDRIEQLIRYVLVGLISNAEFAQELGALESINGNEEKISGITASINSLVFQPLRESLMKKEEAKFQVDSNQLPKNITVAPRPVVIQNDIEQKKQEIRIRTMKSDVMSVKAGIRPSRFTLVEGSAPIQEQVSLKKSRFFSEKEEQDKAPLAEVMKKNGDHTLAINTPHALATVRKDTETVATTRSSAVTATPHDDLPPQRFLPVKLKTPAIEVPVTRTPALPSVNNTELPRESTAPLQTGGFSLNLKNLQTAPKPLISPATKSIPSEIATVESGATEKPLSTSEKSESTNYSVDPYREIPT